MKKGNQTQTSFNPTKLGLLENDTVPIRFIQNTIKPEVTNKSGQKEAVPVIFVNAERWFQIKQSGVVYSQNSSNKQAITPIISIARPGGTIDKGKSRKISIQDPIQTFWSRQYSPENRYDDFNRLRGSFPVHTLEQIVVPTHIDLRYQIGIWTEFSEQMNEIIERIMFFEGTYWYHEDTEFLVYYDDFDTDVASSGDETRLVRGSLTLTMKGLLIPDVPESEKFVNRVSHSPRKVIITERIVNE